LGKRRGGGCRVPLLFVVMMYILFPKPNYTLRPIRYIVDTGLHTWCGNSHTTTRKHPIPYTWPEEVKVLEVWWVLALNAI
jgi:hypothetical protein